MIWILLCAGFTFYGITIGYKNSGTFFYLIWFFFGFICLCLFFHWISLKLFTIVFGLCSIFGIYLLGLILSCFKKFGKPNLYYILVLGAQYKMNGPSNALRFRLEKAYEYLCLNPNTICIVSGGQGYNEPCTESSGMKKYLVEMGLDPVRIIEEDQSTSTIENIVFSKKLMKSNVVGIVTNNFHLYRAIHIGMKQGLHCEGIAARATLWYQPNNIFREMFGIIKDKIKGNM